MKQSGHLDMLRMSHGETLCSTEFLAALLDAATAGQKLDRENWTQPLTVASNAAKHGKKAKV